MAPLILIKPTSAACRSAEDPQIHPAIKINAQCLIASLFCLTVPESRGRAKHIREDGFAPDASGYYRRALWSQTRHPKPETRNKLKCPMVQGQEPPAV